MAVIKTALEIALERTEDIKSDKSTIDQFDAKQQGKRLANAFLAGEADLAAEIKKTPAPQQESLKQGIFDVLITQIALPVVKEDEQRLEKTGKGLQSVVRNRQFGEFYQQLMQIIARYLQEAAHYDQAIRQQYAPKLRRKEEELSRQLGREISIDPMQDPEFAAFYNQNIKAFKSNYEDIIEQAKEEVRRFFSEE